MNNQNKEVEVKDRRTFIYKAWTKHKLLFVLGIAGLTYFAVKKYRK